MPTTIKLKNSVTTTNAPSSLAQGEVAINITDKKVWVGNAATTPIQLLGAGSSGSFGALTCTSLTNSGLTSGRVTYATTAGLLTDSAGLAFDGTNFATTGTISGTNHIVTGGSASGNSMYLATTNAIGFSTNGTERVRIDSSGNVGIGTSSPTAKLTVVTSANNEGVIRVSDNATYYGELSRINATDEVRLGSYGPSQNLTFYTVSSERMRITSGGDLLVGTTTTNSAFKGFRMYTEAQGSYSSIGATGTGGYDFFNFYRGTDGSMTRVGYISTTSSGTTYSTTSDYRLKENIAPMTGALAKVSQLKPVTYTWKSDGSDGQGFIAHELAEVVPDCVTGEKDAVETYIDEEGKEQTRIKPQGVDTSFLVATLTAAIQEQQAQIEALKAEVAALKK